MSDLYRELASDDYWAELVAVLAYVLYLQQEHTIFPKHLYY